MDNLSLNTVDQLNNNQLPGSTLGNDGALQAGKSNSVFSANENSLQYQQLIKDIIKYLNITPEAWMALSDEEKLKNYEIYKSSLNNKIQNQNQSVNDKLVETIQNDNTNIVDETKVTEGNKKFKLDIDVHSAEWQNKTLEEKIDYFVTEYSKYKAGDSWDEIGKKEQEKLKSSNLEGFAKKLPGYDKISKNDQKKYKEFLITRAEVLIENNISFSNFLEMGQTEKTKLFASHLKHESEKSGKSLNRTQKLLLQEDEFNDNVLKHSNLDAKSFDALSAKEQAEAKYAYIENKIKDDVLEYSGMDAKSFDALSDKEQAEICYKYIQNKRKNHDKKIGLNHKELCVLDNYMLHVRSGLPFSKDEDKDLSKSFDALVYNYGAEELRKYERGSKEYNKAYAKIFEQYLSTLSPEEAKTKIYEALCNTSELNLREVIGMSRYLSKDAKDKLYNTLCKDGVGNAACAIVATESSGEDVGSVLDSIKKKENKFAGGLVRNLDLFKDEKARTSVAPNWALSNGYVTEAAEGTNTLVKDERNTLFQSVSQNDKITGETKEQYAESVQKHARSDEDRFYNQEAIHNTGDLDMSAGLAKSIKYLTTREARDRYDEINYNFIEGLDNVDDRKRLTDARFTGMQDLDADEQLSMFNRTMGSKHDDVVNYGASNIDRLDPSVQSDALNSVYATGNDSAVEAAVESIANSPSADVVEKVMPVTVADAAVKTFENNPEIFDALEVTASGKTIKEKIASGARLTLHEYSSLTPAEKREYFMNFFKALSPNEKIKLIKSISSTSVRNNIYKMIARTNNDLFDRLIQDPSVAEVIYNMSNVPGSIKIKIEDVANRKYLSNNAFKDMATESKDSRQEPNSTKNATSPINNIASLELSKRDKYGNILA